MSRTITLLVLVLPATLVACGESSAPTVAPSPAVTPGPVLTHIPLGTPGFPGPSHLAPPDEDVQFVPGKLAWEGFAIEDPTTLAFGPNGRLYVGQLNGQIIALTLAAQTVTAVELIAQADAFGDVLGIAFNPAVASAPTTLYVSHTRLYLGDEGPPFAGTISKLVAPGFEPLDVITGLPVSTAEHGTNGIAFDREGRLYIAQGGTTNAGIPSERHPRPETPLSGAILIADLTDPLFDGSIRYDPPGEASDTIEQAAGSVRVYASGFRNPYDLVVHSNGRIYATDNGPNSTDGARSLSCTSEGPGPSAPDELNLIIEGQYYGHPNRNRGRPDERQCTYRASDDRSGESTPPLATLGYFVSADGMTVYNSDAFGGRLRGNLIYVEWAKGRVWRVVLSDDGTSVVSISQLVPDVLERPLDVAVGPDGALYIAEMGADRISYFVPFLVEPGNAG